MLRTLRKEERGQALIEMALILPILLLLLSGIVEMGRVGYAYVTVNNAARVGARVASIGGTDQDITTAVIQAAPILDPANVTVQISPTPSERQSGGQVTIQVSYPVNLVIPIISGIMPDPFTVGANMTMRLE